MSELLRKEFEILSAKLFKDNHPSDENFLEGLRGEYFFEQTEMLWRGFLLGRQSAPEKAESAYREGWEMGWVERHVSIDNDERVTPFSVPSNKIDDDWDKSNAKRFLPTPPIEGK